MYGSSLPSLASLGGAAGLRGSRVNPALAGSDRKQASEASVQFSSALGVLPIPSRPKGVGSSIEELKRAAGNIKNFKGIFFRNQRLPTSGKFIMNLDVDTGKGTHWVAVDCDHKIYFDPFGEPPPPEIERLKIINRYNTFQDLHMDEDTCGEYCVYVLERLSNDDKKNTELFLKLLH